MDAVMESTARSQGPAHPRRHMCQYPGCEKTFIRKEHLTRHERSHAPQRSFVCYVCQRAFTRNDILRRHVVRHNSSVRATVRNGRACDGCHNSKIKCEGGQPCSPCIKRGMECKVEREEAIAVRDALSNSVITDGDDDFGFNTTAPLPEDRQTIEQDHDGGSLGDPNYPQHTTNGPTNSAGYSALLTSSAPILQMAALNAPDSFIPDVERHEFEMQKPQEDATGQTSNPENGDPISFGNISLLNQKNFPHSIGAWGYPPGNSHVRLIPESVTKQHYELYLDYFHHRWPIIHIPTFEKGDNPYVLSASVEMIGAWLHGSCESKMVALTLHDRLTNHIFQRMYQKPSYADRYKSWPIPFYQAALLNIVFAFYLGEANVLSRAGLLRGMLIFSLRELGFFRPEVAIFQERDATFYPYISGKQEERKRLAISLFKIDCYFSIIRGEPMTLRCDELYFPLLSTFCLYNGPGLHIWEIRFQDEPVQRNQETVSSMISDHSFSSIMQPFMLVEDIQLGLCASQTIIWQYSEKIQSSFEHDISSLIQQKSLRDGLNSWKRVFDQTAIEESEQATPGKTNNIPMKYYYGVESHTEVGWQEVVFNRPRSLLFDTAMLYHLFGLHIHSNLRSFETLARYRGDHRISTSGDGKKDRFPEDRARRWTTVVCSRHAIWHASNILAIHRSKSVQLSSKLQSLDPITHVAVATSSLVVWTYCYFNQKGCSLCIGPAGLPTEVELLDILTNKEQSEKWIELGGQATLDGHIFCRCNAEKLVQIFQERLPTGKWKWSFAEFLSPVLNRST